MDSENKFNQVKEKQTLNAGTYLREQYGYMLKSKDDEGNYLVEDSKGQQQKINVQQFMNQRIVESGYSPNDFKLEVSSPEAPIEDNALGFGTQFKFALAETPKDKARILKEAYGKDAVRFDTSNNSFVIKDKDGDWKRAEANWLTDTLANDSAAMAGAVAGTMLMPGLGTAAGIAVGALGGAIGKLATLGAAGAAGIRTDLDAKEVASELGTELIMGLAGGAILPAAKLASKPITYAFSKVANAVKDAPTTARNVASMISRLHNVPQEAVEQSILREAEITSIRNGMIKEAEENASRILPKYQYLEESVDIVESIKGSIKTRLTDNEKGIYKQFMNNSDVMKEMSETQVRIKEWKESIFKDLESQKIIKRKANKGSFEDQYDIIHPVPEERRRLQIALGALDSQHKNVVGLNLKGAIEFNQTLKKTLNFSQDYSSEVNNFMKVKSDQLATLIQGSIKNPTVKQKYMDMRELYKQGKTFLDTYKSNLNEKKTAGKIAGMIGQSKSAKGFLNDLRSLNERLEITGLEGKMQRLFDIRNADDTMPIFKKGASGMPQSPLSAAQIGLGGAGFGVGGPVGAAVGLGVAAATGPRNIARLVNNPITQKGLDGLRRLGKLNEFIGRLDTGSRTSLLTGDGFSELIRSLEQSYDQEAATAQQLQQIMQQQLSQGGR